MSRRDPSPVSIVPARSEDLPTVAALFHEYADDIGVDRSLGFVTIGPYYRTPIAGTVFMELTLGTLRS